jgi:UDP-glucuronate decarboxylase
VQRYNHVLLTGGTGFFGQSILRYWLNSQSTLPFKRLTILSRDPDKFLRQNQDFQGVPWLIITKADLRTTVEIEDRVDLVIHLAAESTRGPLFSPLQTYDDMVHGTRNILDCAVKNGAKNFFYASSGGVYGGSDKMKPLCESDPILVGNLIDPAPMAYSWAKSAGEHLCWLARNEYGLKVCVGRFFSFSGVGLPFDAHFAVGNFIRDALEDGVIRISGDSEMVRSYLDQTDLAAWINHLAFGGYDGEVINIGSPIPVTIGDLANKCASLVGDGCTVKFLKKPSKSLTGLHRKNYYPDVTKALRYGCKITKDLDQSLNEMISSYPGR